MLETSAPSFAYRFVVYQSSHAANWGSGAGLSDAELTGVNDGHHDYLAKGEALLQKRTPLEIMHRTLV